MSISEPFQETVSLGRALVRSLPGVEGVARCYVVAGSIKRSDSVRVIRSGVVIYPLPGKMAGLDVLREATRNPISSSEHAEDIAAVAAHFECDLHVDGFKELKRHDVVEAYTIE